MPSIHTGVGRLLSPSIQDYEWDASALPVLLHRPSIVLSRRRYAKPRYAVGPGSQINERQPPPDLLLHDRVGFLTGINRQDVLVHPSWLEVVMLSQSRFLGLIRR